MAKNRLIDLNDHLFMQLERLNDDDLDTAALEKEGKRTAFLTDVVDELIRNHHRLAHLRRQRARLDHEKYGGRRPWPRCERCRGCVCRCKECRPCGAN